MVVVLNTTPTEIMDHHAENMAVTLNEVTTHLTSVNPDFAITLMGTTVDAVRLAIAL